MIRAGRLTFVVPLLVAGAACARASTLSDQGGPSHAGAEIDLFRLTLDTIAKAGVPSIGVDVRPLRADVSIVFPRLESLASGADADTTRRAEVRRLLGLVAGDAIALGECPGWTVAASDTAGLRKCTPERRRTVMVSVSRYGGARYADGRSVQRAEVPGVEGVRSVRVLFVDTGPRGGAVESWEYVFAPTSSGWRLLKQVAVYVVE